MIIKLLTFMAHDIVSGWEPNWGDEFEEFPLCFICVEPQAKPSQHPNLLYPYLGKIKTFPIDL